MLKRAGHKRAVIVIKSESELKKVEAASKIVAETLELLRQAVSPGVTTLELDRLAEEHIRKVGAVPAFKGYRGYPASLCASVNNQVVHGIPSERVKLKEGDILGVDLGVVLEGYYGDAAVTLAVGKISPRAARLLEVTEQALYKGIEQALVGNRVSDIGHAVQSFVESQGYSVVRTFVGHGIGKALHEEPQVPNFGVPGRGPRLEPGMTLAIEPMVNEGGWEVLVMEDGWTAVTKDGKLSAHFEHTVAVTAQGPLVLTKTT